MYKKLIIAALVALSSNSLAANCSQNKEVYLPQWLKNSIANYRLYISNISAEDVEVEVKFYDGTNNRYTESSESGSNFSYDGQLFGNPANSPVTLSAGKTGRLTLNTGGATKFGYAKISWSSESCLDSALQVSALYFTTSGLASWRDVNNGLPF